MPACDTPGMRAGRGGRRMNQATRHQLVQLVVELAGTVMMVDFELDGQQFTALNGGPADFRFNEALSLIVNCASQDEVDHYWQRLGEGGEEGDCGWLKDRYGVSWQIIPTAMNDMISDPDPDKSQRAMQAMLQMSKIDIATIERAYRGG